MSLFTAHKFHDWTSSVTQVRRGVLLTNPAADLPAPRTSRLPRRALTEAEACRLVETPSARTHVGQRNRALLARRPAAAADLHPIRGAMAREQNGHRGDALAPRPAARLRHTPPSRRRRRVPYPRTPRAREAGDDGRLHAGRDRGPQTGPG